MAEVKHGEPVRPLGGGRARLSYGWRRLSLRTAFMKGPHGGGCGGPL